MGILRHRRKAFQDEGSTLRDGLRGWWELQEAATNDRVDSHGSNDLYESASDPTQTTGHVDSNAVQFTAANSQFLESLDNADLSVDTDITVAGWVYLDGNTEYQSLISKSNFSVPSEYNLFLNGGFQHFMFKVTDDDGTSVDEVRASTYGIPPVDTWVFIAAGYDSATDDLWISVNDGTVDSETPGFSGLYDGTSRFRLGAFSYEAATWPMDGAMEQWGLWGRTLTSGELTELYNSGDGITYSDTP